MDGASLEQAQSDGYRRPKHCGEISENIAQRTSGKSSLLRLPPELRVRIYQHFINDLQPEAPVNAENTSMRPINTLLSICREARSEALPMFYSQLTFVIYVHKDGDQRSARCWLESLHNDAVDALRKLRFVAPGKEAELQVHIAKLMLGPVFKIVYSKLRWHRCGNGRAKAQQRVRHIEGRLSTHLLRMRLSEKGVPMRREDLYELLDILATWDRWPYPGLPRSKMPRAEQRDWIDRLSRVDTAERP